MQELSGRCQQLQQQLDALKADNAAAEERLKATEQAAGTAASAARRELQTCEALMGPALQQLQLGPELPHCSRQLQELLEKVQQAADALPTRWGTPAKYSSLAACQQTHSQTMPTHHFCMGMGSPGGSW